MLLLLLLLLGVDAVCSVCSCALLLLHLLPPSSTRFSIFFCCKLFCSLFCFCKICNLSCSLSLFLLQILQLCWSLFFVCIFFWGVGLSFVVICLFIFGLCFLQFFWIFFLVQYIIFLGCYQKKKQNCWSLFKMQFFLSCYNKTSKRVFPSLIILYNLLYKCNKFYCFFFAHMWRHNICSTKLYKMNIYMYIYMSIIIGYLLCNIVLPCEFL